MVKWIVVIIAVLGTSWAFKGTIKKLVWKFKHKTWCKTFNFNNLTIIINIKGDSYYVEKI